MTCLKEDTNQEEEETLLVKKRVTTQYNKIKYIFHAYPEQWTLGRPHGVNQLYSQRLDNE